MRAHLHTCMHACLHAHIYIQTDRTTRLQPEPREVENLDKYVEKFLKGVTHMREHSHACIHAHIYRQRQRDTTSTQAA